MNGTKKIRIVTVAESLTGTTVEVDGVEITDILSVSFTHHAGCVPVVKLELLAIGGLVIEGTAEVEEISIPLKQSGS